MKIIDLPKIDPNAPNFLKFIKEHMPEVTVQRLLEVPDPVRPMGPAQCFEYALWSSGGVAIASAWHPNYLLIIGDETEYMRLATQFEREHPDIEITLEIV